MSLPNTMTYVDLTAPGPAENLRLAQAPLPVPQRGELLVRVAAAGVNRPDVLQRLGRYPMPPGANPVLGLEIAGEVVARGEAVDAFQVGDRVCALTNGGGYAEYCVVPAGQALSWPGGYDAVKAAALPETFFTVWANLFQLGRLKAGESVLIHGGTSGIGTTAVQLANAFGARPYVTAGSKEKCEACLALGAAAAFNYREHDFKEALKAVTGGRGVDVILDIVGAKYLASNLGSLAKDGRLVIIAFIGGTTVEKFDLAQLMAKRISITGSAMRPRTDAEKAGIARELEEQVWPLLDAGRCAPVVHRVFPLAQVAEAHRLMESGTHFGKIVLTM